MDQSQVTLLENQASRKKTKQFFILFFIILFTLIISAIISAFTVLKRHAESGSLSANPILAVRSACGVTYNYGTCIRSLSSLQNHTHKIHPSDILALSIRSVFHEFSAISTLPQELASKIDNNNTKPALIDCQNLLIDSRNQLNRSQNVEIIDYDEETVKDLRNLMAQVKNNTGRCLDGLDAAAPQQIVTMKKVKMRIQKAEIYVLNSLEILEKKCQIDEMFDPNFGSNYNHWVQGMKSFLIGRKLWRIVTGDISKPTKEENESDSRFADRLEDWDSKNHQIITWIRNTLVPSIHIQFADYETAKEIWDFLANRYRTTGLAHYYQLWTALHHLKQESGQSVNDFLAQVQPIWNQLSQARISEDHLHLIQVLMALRPEYEAVRASLLHRDPLPTLDNAIQEIIFEETRLGLDKTAEIAFATTQSRSTKPGNQFCKNCNQSGHSFATCPTVECRYCHGIGHILENCPTRPPRSKGGSSKSKQVSKPGSSSIAAAAAEGSILEGSTTITMSDLEALLKQVISSNTSPSTVMSVTPGSGSANGAYSWKGSQSGEII